MAPESLNKVFLIGRATRKPELRYSASRCPVATFVLKIKHGVSSTSSGELSEELFRIIVWGESALTCEQEIRAGDRVFVKGRVEIRRIPDGEHRNIEKVEIIASQVMKVHHKS